MADKQKNIKDTEIQTNGFEERSPEFQDSVTTKGEIHDMVMDILKKSTEDSFEDRDIKSSKTYAGEYADGKKYGYGVGKGLYNATYSNNVKSLIVKNLTYGTKKITNEIYMDYDPENQMLKINYDGTEANLFKGHMNNDDPMGYLISDNLIINTKDKDKLKKALKKFLDNACKKEVDYLLTTKLGVDDKMQTTTNGSMVENKKVMNLKNLLNSSGEEIENYFQSMISESKEKEKKSLLLGDLTEDQKKEYKTFVKDSVKKMFPGKKFSDLDDDDKKSLFNTIDKKWKSEKEQEEELDETTTAGVAGVGGTAGSFGYNSPAAFKKGGDLNIGSEEKKSKKENASYPYNTPLPKSFYDNMKKDHVQGTTLGGSRLDEAKKILKPEQKFDTTKKKFFDDEENKVLGINKRYLITDKLDENAQFEKWRKLSTHKMYDTIRGAEEVINESDLSILRECSCDDSETNIFDKKLYMDREESNDYLEDQFEEENEDDFINVEKPDSFVILKVKKEDFLNESKKFIYDYNTRNYVINPNIQEAYQNPDYYTGTKDLYTTDDSYDEMDGGQEIEVISFEVRGNSIIVNLAGYESEVINAFDFVAWYDSKNGTKFLSSNSPTSALDSIEEIEGPDMKYTLADYIKTTNMELIPN